jgi:hypothetical protein
MSTFPSSFCCLFSNSWTFRKVYDLRTPCLYIQSNAIWAIRVHLKTRGELGCSGRVCSSCCTQNVYSHVEVKQWFYFEISECLSYIEQISRIKCCKRNIFLLRLNTITLTHYNIIFTIAENWWSHMIVARESHSWLTLLLMITGTDKTCICIEYTSSWVGLELTTFVVITTDGIGSSKSNYNAIPATTVPNYQFKIQMKCCWYWN